MQSNEISRRTVLFTPLGLVARAISETPAKDQEAEPAPFTVTTLMFHEVESRSEFMEIIYPILEKDLTPISVRDICKVFQGEHNLSHTDSSLLITLDDGLTSQMNALEAAYEIEKVYGVAVPLLFAVMTQFSPRDDEITASTPSYNDGVHEYLNNEQIIKILENPIHDLANHTINHTDMTDKNITQKMLRDELTLSQKRIAMLYKQAGRDMQNPNVLVYPFGKYDMRAINAVREQGIQIAFSTEPGTRYTLENKYHLGRYRQT